jgi:O-acetyl-ADP-ribose deacetylase (regulator of RNase III)
MRKIKIEVIKSSITNSDTDAIVNAANEGLFRGSGVCGAIFAAAGDDLEEECMQIGHCNTGEAVITKGYNLKNKYIIHAVGPSYPCPDCKKLLYGAYYNSLLLADKNKCDDISFPSISTGVYNYPIIEASYIAFDAIYDFLNDYKDTTIKNIRFYVLDDENFYALNDLIKNKYR